MTEISSIKNNTANTVRKVTKETSNTTSEASPQHSTKQSSPSHEAASGKISKWFALAGVTSSKNTGYESDVLKKLEKRESIKKQRLLQNLENVLDRALDFCSDSEATGNIDADWFFSFVSMAENIYSPLMQELWGKIFAVEIRQPGTFSVRSLKTLKELTQRDAQIFQRAVGFAARKKGEYSPKVLYGYYQKPGLLPFIKLNKNMQLNLAEYGLAYPDILTLMDAGLIYTSEIESGELNINKRAEWRIGQNHFFLAPSRRGLCLNYYKFTPTGAELSKLVNADPIDKYISDLTSMLASAFEITSE